MKSLREISRLGLAGLFMLGGLSLAACEEQGPMEEAGEAVDEAVEEAAE